MFTHEMYSIGIRSSAQQRGLPAPGTSVLIVDSDLTGGVREVDDPRPFTPVVLVDGEPVAAGFGRADVDLEPGTHLVEVQSGGSGAYWTVRAAEQRFVRLSSFVPQRRKGPEAVGAARFAGQTALVPTRSVPPRPSSRLTTVTAVAGAAAALLSTALFDDAVSGSWAIALVMTVLLVVGAVAGHWVGRLAEAGLSGLVSLRLALWRPKGRHASRQVPGGSWRPLDPRERSVPDADGSVLRLALAFTRAPNPPGDTVGEVLGERGVLAAADRYRRFGEEYPPEVRPWVERPLVWVDGAAVPAIWGVNEYRLAPGSHRVQIGVPGPPEVLVGEGTAVEVSRHVSTTVDLSPTGVGEVSAAAEIAVEPGHDGWELDRYAATLRLQRARR